LVVVDAIVQKSGRLDVLINNAGIAALTGLPSASEWSFQAQPTDGRPPFRNTEFFTVPTEPNMVGRPGFNPLAPQFIYCGTFGSGRLELSPVAPAILQIERPA
jgi:hypothetical protein